MSTKTHINTDGYQSSRREVKGTKQYTADTLTFRNKEANLINVKNIFDKGPKSGINKSNSKKIANKYTSPGHYRERDNSNKRNPKNIFLPDQISNTRGRSNPMDNRSVKSRQGNNRKLLDSVEEKELKILLGKDNTIHQKPYRIASPRKVANHNHSISMNNEFSSVTSKTKHDRNTSLNHQVNRSKDNPLG